MLYVGLGLLVFMIVCVLCAMWLIAIGKREEHNDYVD